MTPRALISPTHRAIRAYYEAREAYRASRIAPEKFEEFRKFLNQTSRVERQRLRLRPAR